MKMEAIRSSEMSVHTRSTRRYIPEDGIFTNKLRLIFRSELRSLCRNRDNAVVIATGYVLDGHGTDRTDRTDAVQTGSGAHLHPIQCVPELFLLG
jgi:hypothetical protein